MILDLEHKSNDSLAVIDSYSNQLTYGELVAFSDVILESLPKRSVVFVLCKNNVGGVAWTIGMIRAGVVPLLLNANIEQGLFDELMSKYAPSYICVPNDRVEDYSYTDVVSHYGYTILATGNPEYPIHEDLSHLLPTSGSTGSPKLVRHSYENISVSSRSVATFFALDSSDKPLLVLPLYYTMGLSVIFSHLYAGSTILITDLNMTQREFWTFIKEQQATSFTGVPYSFEILKMMRFFRMDLPHLTLLTQGGGKMNEALNRDFAEYCQANNKRWIATYGQTEGTARMAYLPSVYAAEKVGSIGQAIPGGELSLVDADGNEINAPHTRGEMCYRGGNVTLGYAQQKTDLMNGDERKGFLATGDIAYRDEDGCYFIVGRQSRFLKLFGMRVGLDECEQIIKTAYNIACACVGTDDKMVIYITDSSYDQQVKEELVKKTSIVASAFQVRVIDEIPKNEAGKVLYSQLDIN